MKFAGRKTSSVDVKISLEGDEAAVLKVATAVVGVLMAAATPAERARLAKSLKKALEKPRYRKPPEPEK